MGAGDRAIDLHEEVVGDDLVVLEDPPHEAFRLALPESLAQRALVVAVAGAALERTFGHEHAQGPGLAATAVGFAIPSAASRSFSSGSVGTYPDFASFTLPSGPMATMAGTVQTLPSHTP